MSTKQETTTPAIDETKPVTLAAWKKRSTHTVVLNSGATVVIKIPDLPQLVESGTLPQHLLDAAIGAQTGVDEINEEYIKKEYAFAKFICKQVVVEPAIADEDYDEIPAEDKELLVQFATRRREFDALGKHIAGLDNVAKFRQLHSIGEFSPYVEGA